MNVLVAGASGFIGRAAVRQLLADGHRVVALSRHPGRQRWDSDVEAVAWDARSPLALEGDVDAIVHLDGASAARRWTRRHRQAMRTSRVDVADRLVEWAAARPPGRRPAAFVTASAVGYYGLAPAGPRREDAPAGSDFLASLCRDWEAAAGRAGPLGMRVVALRFGVVLHPEGGALKRLLPPFRLGAGGPLGSGRQPLPWVHREDAARAVAWAVAEPRAEGAYNVASPQETDMQGFARSLAAALRRPAFVRVPGVALRLLAGRGPAAVVLGGQVAPPDRILRAGFRFAHPDLGPALRQMLGAAAER